MAELKLYEEMPSPIRLRGHTLLCLLGFERKGYSPSFIDNMNAVHRTLLTRPETMVEVVEFPDAVCGACPHLALQGCTLNGDRSEEEMVLQDRDVLARLGLEAGARLRWQEILDRIRSAVRGGDLPTICGTCRWLSLGVCSRGIEQLRASAASTSVDVR